MKTILKPTELVFTALAGLLLCAGGISAYAAEASGEKKLAVKERGELLGRRGK